MKKPHYQIGIDLGGTDIKAGLVSNGELLKTTKIKTAVQSGENAIITDMAGLVNVLSEGIPFAEIDGIGIGVPGLVDSVSGIVTFAGNINFKNVPLVSKLSKLTNLPVYIMNDASVAMLAEHAYGSAQGYDSAVMVTIGTGIGCGMVLGGEIFEGTSALGGEIGHMVICANGLKCNGCGRLGCYEMYASTSALVRQTKKAMQGNLDSLLWQVCDGILENVNGKTVFDGAELGDQLAISVLDEYLYMLSVGLVNIINIIRPQAIVLGGGICGQGEKLLNPLRKLIDSQLMIVSPKVKLHIATHKNDAGILGGSLLVKNNTKL